jgi:hypothetical protein
LRDVQPDVLLHDCLRIIRLRQLEGYGAFVAITVDRNYVIVRKFDPRSASNFDPRIAS